MTKRGFYCGLDAALSIVGGKWKFLVLWQLAVHGPLRFGQLRRLVDGVTEKMLISALKDLEADNALVRKDFQEVPPHVEYSLTAFGASLAEALRPLCEWGEAHMDLIVKTTNQPVRELSDTAGRDGNPGPRLPLGSTALRESRM